MPGRRRRRAEQLQPRLAGLRDRSRGAAASPVPCARGAALGAVDARSLQPGDDAGGVDRRDGLADGCLAGDREHRRGRQLAQAEARAPQPADRAVPRGRARRPERALEVGAGLLGAGEPAGDVVADVGDGRRARLRREQRVERGDAVRLGGRHGQAPADVVEARLGDLPDPVLQRVQRREQQVAAAPGFVPAARDVPIGQRCPGAPPCQPRLRPGRAPHRPPPAPPATRAAR